MTIEKENIEREKVVAVAQSWVETPYHHMGCVKGKTGGVDCLTLLACVFVEAGLIAKPEIPYYPPDWHLHKDAERYLEGVCAYAKEVEREPLPGDIVVWKFGRCFSHGAIVISWPSVVHAYVGTSCRYEDAERAVWLAKLGESMLDNGKPRPRRTFSFWG